MGLGIIQLHDLRRSKVRISTATKSQPRHRLQDKKALVNPPAWASRETAQESEMSAKSDYQTQQERITKLLMRLDEGLRKHDREFAGDPRNYGYPGDLKHVASLLEEASNFINQEGE